MKIDGEVYALSLPDRVDWNLDPEGVADVIYKDAKYGASLIVFSTAYRGDPSIGPYENNTHDYRGDSYFHTELLTGERFDVRFDKHICSSIGGWYGVFECDPHLEGIPYSCNPMWRNRKSSIAS